MSTNSTPDNSQYEHLAMLCECTRNHPEIPMLVWKLHKDTKLPAKKFPEDAGYDIFAPYGFYLDSHERIKISLGFGGIIPRGFVSLLWDKSGIASDGIHRMGGVLDCHYTGEWKLVLINLSTKKLKFERDEPIIQVLFQKVENVLMIEGTQPETARGVQGFSSSQENKVA